MMIMDPHWMPVVGIIAFVGALTIGARAVMKPVINAFLRARELKAGAGADPARLDAQDRRIAELESDLSAVRQELDRLSAVESFYAQLQAPQSTGARDLPPGRGPAAAG